MNSPHITRQISMVLFSAYLIFGINVLPKLAFAQTSTQSTTQEAELVAAAKTAIDNYFSVLLNGQNAAAERAAMESAINAIHNPTDQITIGAYYDQTALAKAKLAVDQHFAVLMAAQDPAKSSFVLESTINAVYNPTDKITIGAYYDQIALAKAKLAVDQHFAVLMAAQDPAKSSFVLESTINAVYNPTDKITIGKYYDQIALAKAKLAVDQHFAVLMAAQDPAKSSFVLESTINAVYNPTDKITIGAYYDQTSYSKTTSAIYTYFYTLMNAQDPAKAKFVMESLINSVHNPTYQSYVTSYYTSSSLVYSRSAITSYFRALLAGTDPAKAKFIMETLFATIPTDKDRANIIMAYNTSAANHARNTINQYFQTVWALQDAAKAKYIMESVMDAVTNPPDRATISQYYDSLNNLASGHLTAPELNSGFGQSAAVIENTRELFVGAPSLSGKGAIYHYKSLPEDTTATKPEPILIAPADLQTGDQFGKALVADNTTLIVQAKTSLYFYSRVNGNWVQTGNKVDLNKIESLDPTQLQEMKLALLGDNLAVGLPSAGTVYVFSRVSGVWTYATALRLPALAASQVQFAQSVAVGDGVIAVGAPKRQEPEKSKIFVYRKNGQFFWTLEQTFENTYPHFGRFVGLLTPGDIPLNTTGKVVGHQLVTAFNIESSFSISTGLSVFNEEVTSVNGTQSRSWITQPTYPSLGGHSYGSRVKALAAKGKTFAVALQPTITPPVSSGIQATNSLAVFGRQADSSVKWMFSFAGGAVPNFANGAAMDASTIVATHPVDDSTSTIKSGVVVLAPKVAK